MFETPFHVVGTIVTDPLHRRVGDQQVIKFRVASNSRRRTADGEWETGHSLFVNVDCWGRLVTGAAALVKGDPVVVVGYVYTSEYIDGEGNRRSSTDVRATAIGPDLARATVRIEQRKRADPLEGTSEEPSDDDEIDPEADEVEPDGLPLTA
ncbi:single-stranded DNA-binding protein [Mycolicibacterium sp. 050158]|uniref:single-stranded DNA-binding protein n=1 Tax=Mycolicibacterium sp. 050158 TaxID=3090602 RepID=UPI00299DBA93|nr:single-stranded DNA-binding protein [Mycolicibacterium sp. 050158]MDX1891441.1 single-stranded DNA-binding protein [Mycolicibacterium sp. 050158]